MVEFLLTSTPTSDSVLTIIIEHKKIDHIRASWQLRAQGHVCL